MTYQPSVSDDIYRNYMFLLEGEWTPEKSEYIADERAAIDKILEAEDIMDDKFEAGEIAQFDYSDYRKDLYDAKVRDGIFARVEAQEAHILALKESGMDAHFVYATGWNAMYEQNFDFFLYGLVVVLAAQIFSVEFHGMQTIMRATKKGRGRILVTKFLLAITLAAGMGALFAFVDYRKMMELYTYTAGHSPAQSLPMLAELPLSLSLREFFFLYEGVKIVAFILLAVITVSMSILIRKSVHAMATTMLLTIVPFVLRYFGFGFAKYLDFTCLLSGSQYLRMALDSTLYFVLFTVGMALLTVTVVAAGCKKWRGNV